MALQQKQMGKGCMTMTQDEIIQKQAEEIERFKTELQDYREYHQDQQRLARELDAIINGDDAAAQCSLIDLFGQIKELVALRTKFNGLVGELKQLVPVITYDKYGEYGESSEWYSLTAVQSILTKYTEE